jgi:hypothetical protein
MSDLLAAAAEALGTPESLVKRSAEARAAASGMTVDEVLAAWAGGASVAGPAPEPAAATAEEATPPSVGETPTGPPAAQGDNPPPSVGETPQVVIEIPAVAATAAAPAASTPAPSGKPPILVAEPDRPVTVLAGVMGLFVAVLLVGLVGPSIATENPGARTSAISYSDAAQRGQEIYQNLGCGSCHTQMVRPIVSDVGLGAVTLNDSNQVLGTRRFGPDLSDVGTRLSGSQIEAIITGFQDHPAALLSESDLEDLVTYLLESTTTVPGQTESPDAGEETAGENADAGASP